MLNIDQTSNTISISDARSQLSQLVGQITDQPVILTQRGKVKAVLLKADYWEKVIKALDRVYQRTFMKPELMPYTREFSDTEIEKWAAEDRL